MYCHSLAKISLILGILHPISNPLSRKYKSSSASKAKNKAAALREVTEGLLEYFNVMLGAQLLYKFEREQVSS